MRTREELLLNCMSLRRQIHDRKVMLATAALTADERKRREENLRNIRVLLQAQEEMLTKLELGLK